MKVIERDLENYIKSHSTKEDDILIELTRETNLNVVQPRMLSGHIQGKILELIVKMYKPKRVLEIGTFTGYSAICMAKSLQPSDEFHTIDINDELSHISAKYIKKSGLDPIITQHIGSALEVVAKIGGVFDLVFIDGDKREYPQYYNMLFDGGHLKSGSVLLADNTLWDGKVVDDSIKNQKDKYTQGVLEFNRIVACDPRVEVVILPFRDGLSLIIVK